MDCLDFSRKVASQSVDLIIIDPPYNTTRQAWDQRDVVTEVLAAELWRVLKPTGSIYVFCGIGEKSQSLIRWFPIFAQHFTFKDLITWKKRRGIGMRRGWLYTREEIMWFVKDNKQFRWNKEHQYSTEPNQFEVGMSGHAVHPFKRITNVWTDIGEQLGYKGTKHYTPKPAALLQRIILAHTLESDLVFDCFAGSGSTLFAALALGRRAAVADDDVEAVEEIRGRLAASGQQVSLLI
jgi:site-specific DNA-methyltransferase (adenine-specific)